jgi:hypothetical protein
MPSAIQTDPDVAKLIDQIPEPLRIHLQEELATIDGINLSDRSTGPTIGLVAACTANRVDHVACAIGNVIEGMVVGAYVKEDDKGDVPAHTTWFSGLWVRESRRPEPVRCAWLDALIKACAAALIKHHRKE